MTTCIERLRALISCALPDRLKWKLTKQGRIRQVTTGRCPLEALADLPIGLYFTAAYRLGFSRYDRIEITLAADGAENLNDVGTRLRALMLAQCKGNRP